MYCPYTGDHPIFQPNDTLQAPIQPPRLNQSANTQQPPSTPPPNQEPVIELPMEEHQRIRNDIPKALAPLQKISRNPGETVTSTGNSSSAIAEGPKRAGSMSYLQMDRKMRRGPGDEEVILAFYFCKVQ